MPDLRRLPVLACLACLALSGPLRAGAASPVLPPPVPPDWAPAAAPARASATAKASSAAKVTATASVNDRWIVKSDDPDELRDNPRDHKRFMFNVESYFPWVSRMDVAVFFNRNVSLGMAFLNASASTDYGSAVGTLLNPRLKFYEGHWFWSPYFKLGLIWAGSTVVSDYGKTTDNYSAWAGDLGFGVNYINEGPLTMGFELSVPLGTAGSQNVGNLGASNVNIPVTGLLLSTMAGVVF